ncbi:MAG: hypothetical protein R3321_12015, partial [Nitrososphaeraceae archaeon]|nr:hypothetical protein [Nitrososphaeraceae archaeon]
QMTLRYYDITEKYFELYKFPNQGYVPECITSEEYENEYEKSSDVDLLIVVYDRNKGRTELHENQIGGLYNHIGEELTHNHTIIFCDCSNFQYSDPPWILTHELSHFILYYLGYDSEIVERLIHSMDAKYDYCVEVEYNEAACATSKTLLDTEYHRWAVMAPYEPAIGKSFFGDKKIKEVSPTPYQLAMHTQITHWWLDGKINDEDYAQSLEIMTNKKISQTNGGGVFETKESPHIIFTDSPKEKKLEMLQEENEIQWIQQYENQVLQMVPFVDETIFKDSINDNQLQIPDWYKTRALWWVTEKISDEEYINGIKYILED